MGTRTANPTDESATRTSHTQKDSKLHKADRADVIWTDEDLEKVRPYRSPDLWRAVQAALLTGLSIADLARLPWSAFDGEALEGHRQKTGRPFLIPVLPD